MGPEFAIQESPTEGGKIRLTLRGELDMATAAVLDRRLGTLRAERLDVLLDLSQLEFIDSSGLQALIGAIAEGERDGWGFAIEPGISPSVMRVLEMVKLDHLIELHLREG